MTHEEILEIYRKTEFMVRDVNGSPAIFHVNDTTPHPVLKLKRFAIITAWNPDNAALSEGENRERNIKLEIAIKALGHNYYPSIGRLGEHAEEGFTIEGISERDAIKLGTVFGQYAVLFNDEWGPRFLFL